MNILLVLALFITHSVAGLSITDLLDNIPLCAVSVKLMVGKSSHIDSTVSMPIRGS